MSGTSIIAKFSISLSHMIKCNLASPRGNLIHVHVLLYANSKDGNQPAHPWNLISTFVVRSFECITTNLPTYKVHYSLHFMSTALAG